MWPLKKEDTQSEPHIHPGFLLGIPSKPKERQVEPNRKQQPFLGEENKLEYRAAEATRM